MTPLQIATIIGSTRQGRVGEAVGRWFATQAQRRADIDLSVLDLVDFEIPARYPHQATASMMAFAAGVGRADAFVVVTPEYNHSFPASLKQAIDCAYDEWRAKPVGFVSYGCGSQGLYAVEQLRVVFTELHAVTMRNCVGFDLLREWSGAGGRDLDGTGRPRDAESSGQAVIAMLDQLAWWGLALRDARAARPYVS
jgi:NAD(P)H-dependent FMN reductase